MKAVIIKGFGSVDNFELAEIPVPGLKNGEVRIRIKAISFNPVDYQIRKGQTESAGLTSNILGRDLSGIIDEVAGDVPGFKKGDEVICYVCNLGSNGTYAEYVTVPAALVGRKPASLSHPQAAAIAVAGITAWLSLSKTRAGKSTSVFIAGGAGGVGTFTIMFAQYFGVKNIVTTAGNEKSLAYLTQTLGLKEEQIINYKEHDFVEKAIAANGGYFDVAIDLAGGKMLSACCALLAIDGNLASVTDPPEWNDFDILFKKNASFHAVGANAYSLSPNPEHWLTYQHLLNQISVLFDSGALKPPPVTIVGPFSVDTVKKAHELLENSSVQGKLVMEIEG